MSTTGRQKDAEQLRQQTALAKFGELALRSTDLDEILTRACALIGEALGTDLAKVMELQNDGRTLFVRAGVGWKPGVVGVVTLDAHEDSSEGHTLKTGEPMTSPDIARETRFKYPPFLTDNGVKAVANVVIIGGKDRPPYGVLQIDSRTPRQFTADDTAFLRGYANLLAATVDRLRVIGEVRNGEARLRLALESGKLGSWEVDVASGTATRTVGYDRIFGYTGWPASWTAETFLDHVLSDDRAYVARKFDHAAKTRSEWDFECRIVRADDGQVRWIEARGRSDASRDNAPATHLLGIVADITERKDAEALLLRSNEQLERRVAERTAELTEANARLKGEADERERIEEALRQSHKMEAVGQLTGGLAHDFNNLLAGISGSLELMRIRAEQGRTAELGRYIDAAMESADRAAALTHRLLAFSRRQTLDQQATDVGGLVAGMTDLFRRTVGPAIRIETRFPNDAWQTLCDGNALESALLNLVINSRDAMPNGGNLRLELSNVTIPTQGPGHSPDLPSGDYVSLQVTDDGVGMTPEVMARAFDPFFTTKPQGQGTGLGLSMMHGFVQQTGGHVRLRSKPGHGTTVTIYLGRYVGATAEQEADAARAAKRVADNSVVLVVEDEATVRMVIMEALSDSGYTVLEAVDGPTGLRILDSGARVDLLVTDVGLPGGMNGRQLAEAARQRRRGLKVLFVTGYAENAVVGNDNMELGMQLMTKPFAVAALTARVEGMIRN